jgi:hypothetical protein
VTRGRLRLIKGAFAPKEHITTIAKDPLIGQTLDGRFEVQELIGIGAVGRVYRAVQKPLERRVALKVLNRGLGEVTDELFRKRFFLEASLTSKLTHPNTVTVIDHGCTADGTFYLAMEFLDGETLEEAIHDARGMPWPRAFGIAQQIGRSLREAHQQGVIHRDLKPANVMLLHADEEVDQVKVLDFGLVKAFLEPNPGITQEGALLGSPGYMAPEQAERNASDPRSDIYSLGVTLFECIAGRAPFEGENQIEVVLKQMSEPVPPLVAPRGRPRVVPEVEALVRKCLEKKPEARYQSMEDVLAALQEVLELAPRRTGWRSRVAGWRPLLVGVGLAVALMAGAVAWRFAFRPRNGRVVEVVPPLPAAEASPPRAIQFRVESEPPGARVTHRGQPIGTTPFEFSIAPDADGLARAELAFSLKGFAPVTLSAAAAGPRIELNQKLHRERPEKKRTKRRRR